MKTKPSNSRRGMTLMEVSVVIAVIVLLIVVLLPLTAVDNRPRMARRINCVNNLKQISLATYSWALDHGGLFPTAVSMTNGGSMEPASSGSVFATFQVLSNELATTKLLVCAADTKRTMAGSCDVLSKQNVSYFIGLDASTNYPSAFLYGDDNLEISGKPIKSGLAEVAATTPIGWTNERHSPLGNVGLADGSVQQWSSSRMQNELHNTGLATNRLAIP